MLIIFCQSVQNTLESTNRSLETSLGSSTAEREKGGEEGRGGRGDEGRGGRGMRGEEGGGRGERMSIKPEQYII